MMTGRESSSYTVVTVLISRQISSVSKAFSQVFRDHVKPKTNTIAMKMRPLAQGLSFLCDAVKGLHLEQILRVCGLKIFALSLHAKLEFFVMQTQTRKCAVPWKISLVSYMFCYFNETSWFK